MASKESDDRVVASIKFNDSASMLKYFGFAQTVELRQKSFTAIVNSTEIPVSYNSYSFVKDILDVMSESIEELIIVERPCNDSVIRHLCSSAKKLRKVIVLDNIPQRDEQWIRHHAPNAKLTFPVLYLSKLLKSSTYKELAFDQITFESLLIPFKDLASFQSIKILNIHGSFKNAHLTSENIKKFVQFINGFPKLKSIEACFVLQPESSAASLQPLYQDSYDGFVFYEIIKQLKATMFKNLSEKVHGKIHFEGKINSFQNMCTSMKYNLNQSRKALKPPVEYNEVDSVIQRKFRAHHGLQIEFSITPASY